MGKGRLFSDSSNDEVYQSESNNENFVLGSQQNAQGLGGGVFNDSSGYGNFPQSGRDQRNADLNGALFRGNLGFTLDTAVLDVTTSTINLLEDASGNPLARVSIDKIVTISSGDTSDLITILGAQRTGQRLRLYNIDTNTITIKNTGSAIDNTIFTPGALDFVLSGNGVVDLTYDITTAKWRIVGGIGGGGSGGISYPILYPKENLSPAVDGTATIDVSLTTGNAKQIQFPAGDISFDITGDPVNTVGQDFYVVFLQDSVGGRSLTSVDSRIKDGELMDTLLDKAPDAHTLFRLATLGGGTVYHPILVNLSTSTATALSTLAIDVDKDWAGRSISNFGGLNLFANSMANNIINMGVLTFVSDAGLDRGQFGRSDFFAGASNGLVTNIPNTDSITWTVDLDEKFRLDGPNDKLISSVDLDMNTFDITNIDRAIFTPSSGAPSGVDNPQIYVTTIGNGDLIFNNINTEAIAFTHSNVIGLQETVSTLRKSRTDGLPFIDIVREGSVPTAGISIGDIRGLFPRTTSGETLSAIMSFTAEDTGDATYEGGIAFQINQIGTSNTFMRMNDATNDLIDMFRDTDHNSNDIINVDRLQLSGGTTSATSTDDIVWYLTDDPTMNPTSLVSNVGATDSWIWSSDNVVKMILTDSTLEKRNVTSPSFQLYNTRTAAVGDAGTINILANTGNTTTGVAMGFIIARTEVATTDGSGSLKLGVNLSGTATNLLTLNDSNNGQVDILSDLNMNTFDINNIDSLEQEETGHTLLHTFARPETLSDDTVIGEIRFRAFDGAPSPVLNNYAMIKGVMDNDTNTLEDGRLEFWVVEDGDHTGVKYLDIDGDLGQVQFFRPISMFGNSILLDSDGDTSINSLTDDTMQFITGDSLRLTISNTAILPTLDISMIGGNDITNINFLDLVEQSTPGTPATDHISLYAKDSSGDSRLFYIGDDGTEIGPLGTGGSGVTFPIDFPEEADRGTVLVDQIIDFSDSDRHSIAMTVGVSTISLDIQNEPANELALSSITMAQDNIGGRTFTFVDTVSNSQTIIDAFDALAADESISFMLEWERGVFTAYLKTGNIVSGGGGSLSEPIELGFNEATVAATTIVEGDIFNPTHISLTQSTTIQLDISATTNKYKSIFIIFDTLGSSFIVTWPVSVTNPPIIDDSVAQRISVILYTIDNGTTWTHATSVGSSSGANLSDLTIDVTKDWGAFGITNLGALSMVDQIDMAANDLVGADRIQVSGGTESATSVDDIVFYLTGDYTTEPISLVSNVGATDSWIWSLANVTKMILTDSTLEKRHTVTPSFQLYNTRTAEIGTAATIAFLANTANTSTGVAMGFIIADTEVATTDGEGSLKLGVNIQGASTNFITLNDSLDAQVSILKEVNMNSLKITNLLDPTADQEAATKKYVDDNAGIPSSIVDGNTTATVLDSAPSFAVALDGNQKFSISNTRVDYEELALFGVTQINMNDSEANLISSLSASSSGLVQNIVSAVDTYDLQFNSNDAFHVDEVKTQILSTTPNTTIAALYLFRDDPSPVVGDVIAELQYRGRDLSANNVIYGKMGVEIEDRVALTSEGSFRWSVRQNNVVRDMMNLKDGIIGLSRYTTAAASGAALVLNRNDSTAVIGDEAGEIDFNIDAGTETVFGNISVSWDATTNGDDSSRMDFKLLTDDSLQTILTLRGSPITTSKISMELPDESFIRPMTGQMGHFVIPTTLTDPVGTQGTNQMGVTNDSSNPPTIADLNGFFGAEVGNFGMHGTGTARSIYVKTELGGGQWARFEVTSYITS